MIQGKNTEFELSQEELQSVAISGGKNENTGIAVGTSAIAAAVAARTHFSYKVGKIMANHLAGIGEIATRDGRRLAASASIKARAATSRAETAAAKETRLAG